MTFSYDPSTLAADTVDQVRLTIGDTVDTGHMLEDEEIQFFLDSNSENIYLASSRICTSLAARYSRLVDKNVGDLRIRSSEKSKQFAAQAITLFNIYQRQRSAYIYAGGVTNSDKALDRANTDINQPSFTKDMMETGPDNVTRPALITE